MTTNGADAGFDRDCQRGRAEQLTETEGFPAVSSADLGGLRTLIFKALQETDIATFHQRLGLYGALLERLVQDAASDPVSLLRLRSDHCTFFEQIKATLVTNRIRLRLELERVNASRQYNSESPRRLSVSDWQG